MCKQFAAWLVVLFIFACVGGCESSNDTGADAGPTIEQLTAQSQAKNKEASSTDGTTADEKTTSSTDSRTDATAQSGNAEPAIAQKASERPPQRSSSGTYAGAVFGASRSIRIAADDLAWKKSVQLFEAEHGRKPKDTKEFMERIKSEGTRLPDIEPGTEYFYQPAEGQFGELYQVPIGETPSDAPSSPDQP
jgi:hypothetical protein